MSIQTYSKRLAIAASSECIMNATVLEWMPVYFSAWMNPTLTSFPPSLERIEAGEVCYLGPNGEISSDKVVLCKDLPFDMVGSVGSWYLSPERHLLEFPLLSIIFGILVAKILPKLKKVSHHSSQSSPVLLRPPNAMRQLILLIFALQSRFKLLGYRGKILSMLLPCNFIWFLAMILSFYPNLDTIASNTIIQLWLNFLILPIAALAQPDFSDTVLFGEKEFFYFHHTLLVVIPLYFLFSKKVTTLTRPIFVTNVQWVLLSGSLFGLMYVTVVTPVSIASGLNLNYMLHPPPGFPFKGQNYRLWSIASIWSMVAMTRFCLVIIETCFTLNIGKRSKNKLL